MVGLDARASPGGSRISSPQEPLPLPVDVRLRRLSALLCWAVLVVCPPARAASSSPTLLFVGDISLAGRVQEVMARGGPQAPFVEISRPPAAGRPVGGQSGMSALHPRAGDREDLHVSRPAQSRGGAAPGGNPSGHAGEQPQRGLREARPDGHGGPPPAAITSSPWARGNPCARPGRPPTSPSESRSGRWRFWAFPTCSPRRSTPGRTGPA